MIRFLSIAAAALTLSGPVHAQAVLSRDVRIDPAPAAVAQAKPAVKVPVVVVFAQPVAAQPVVAKAQPNVPKNGQANGKAQVVPAIGQTTVPENSQLQIRDALNGGLKDVAESIRSLNPSYALAPMVGNGAMTAGSFYIRTSAVPVGYESSYGPYGAYSPVTWLALPPLALPAPIVLGGPRHAAYPSWLYTGTVRVDVPPSAPIRTVAAEVSSTSELTALREEVRQLRAMIEKLNEHLKK